MIEQILERSLKLSDKVEIYSIDGKSDNISFENSILKDIGTSMLSGISLRIIKDGIQGFSYTRNLLNQEELIQNALDSLRGKADGLFDFPCTKDIPSLSTYDSSIESISNSKIMEECIRICNILGQKTKGQINLSAYRTITNKRIVNSSGTDLSLKSSAYILNTEILYPYTSASIHRLFVSKSFEKAKDDYLDFLANIYNNSLKEVIPQKQRMKVLFLPETIYVLMWRLQSATSGQSIYQKISPLIEKIGEKIFDDKLFIYNNPLEDSLPGATPFDDEGTKCNYFPIIEKGILKNYYYDLYFANKLNTHPTGHGFRDSISSKPAPSLKHLFISPGILSFHELIKSIDCGIIVADALGAHSGNIPHGDFSIGVSPAIYVERGEIIGHVKDVMVAGNIYDTLKEIVEIEDTLHPSYGGNYPAMLFDNVKVTIKQ